ncbi:6913_t:CDS:2, partial [Dentiscutata heterogama]
MPREALIKNLERQLSSGKCDLGKVAIQYLTETEKLLSRQLKYLQIKVKNLQDELNELKKENNYLRNEMNQLSHNFSLIQLNENKKGGELINRKEHERKNALKKIQEIIDAYKRKYEQHTIEAGPSKIIEIIEDEDLIIETKSTFVKLEIPEILAEIANNLFPRDILNFLLVNRSVN